MVTRMAQEDQTQKCSSTSSGGFGSISRSSSKKTKQKKVPQRGLGVAQLEKIRLEEQQKKAATAILSTAPSSLSSPTKPSCSSAPNRHFYHSNQSPSSIPIPSLPSLDLPSPNSIFRPPFPPQNVDVRKPNSSTVPLANNNGRGVEMQGHHGNVPNLWSPCEYNFDKESSSGLDPGLAFRSTLNNLPFESNPIWPLTNLPQRKQQHQFHQQPPTSSMVKVSSATSSSSSVLNFQIEPPSNQSYYSNYTPMWPEEKKMVGIKRPYPFSLENPPGPSINFKFPTFVAPIRTTDEATSCANRGTFNLEPAGNPNFREGPPCSTSISDSNSKSNIKENGSVNGDFLTLAPPTTSWACPSPKLNLPSAYVAFHNHEVPDFESFPYQGSAVDTIFQPGPSSSSSNPQQANLYSFFPPSKAQIGRAAATIDNCNGGVGESVDLNLKL